MSSTYLTSLTQELRAECWKQLVKELKELQREITKGVWSTLLSSLIESEKKGIKILNNMEWKMHITKLWAILFVIIAN